MKCNAKKDISLFPIYYRKKNPDNKTICATCHDCRYGKINLKTAKKRLEKHILKKKDCWEWLGSVTVGGYGETNYKGRHINAHRLAWMVYKGEVPDGLLVLHKCDVRTCCNPRHLFLGTPQDNMDDMMRKGRHNILKGHECPWAKFTDDQIREIRQLIKEGQGPTMLSKKFNVKRGVISDIRLGKTYKNVI